MISVPELFFLYSNSRIFSNSKLLFLLKKPPQLRRFFVVKYQYFLVSMHKIQFLPPHNLMVLHLILNNNDLYHSSICRLELY